MDRAIALRGRDYKFNDFITIHFPTFDEIVDYGIDDYFGVIYKFCSTPSDYKVWLADCGINYDELDDYEFFLILADKFDDKEKQGLRMVFGDFDISEFEITTDTNNNVILALGNKIFDKAVYLQIVDILRMVHNFTRRADKPGNEHTRKYIIEKERRQLKRRRKKEESPIIGRMVALINSQEFKYDYETIWKLNVFQFNESLRQIQKNKNFTFVMQGIYAGTVDGKKINMNNIHWLSSDA